MLSHSAIQALFSCVGGSSLALDQPIQRMWRDANAIALHVTLSWDAVSTMAGQRVSGLDPKGAYCARIARARRLGLARPAWG